MQVHQRYLEAGAEILETNTFGANSIKLSGFGLEDKTYQINLAGAQLARKVAKDQAYVAGSIGPTGKMMEPYGNLTFDDAKAAFKAQIEALVQGGVDLILIETMSDLREAKAAVLAAREVCQLPIICQMSYPQEGRTMMGADPAAAVIALQAMGVEVVGANCGSGPSGMLDVIGKMAEQSTVPLSAQPNAGLPKYVDGRFIYLSTPEYLADYAKRFIEAGASIIGGCCGTTPAHIAAMASIIKTAKPKPRTILPGVRLSGRREVVYLGAGNGPVVIGQRINPSNRPEMARDIADGQFDLARDEARAQVEAGAKILDINVAIPDTIEGHSMERAIELVQEVVDVPLAIDSVDPVVLEHGLQAVEGRPVINSINADPERLAEVLPLAKKYGAALIGITVDQNGVPETAEDRLRIAKQMLDAVEKAGLSKNDLLIDCVVTPAAAESDGAVESLRALELIKSELGVPTVLGISVVSYGLPERHPLNATFLAMALSHGLDAAIVDPLDPQIMETVRASLVLLGNDEYGAAYAHHRHETTESEK
jgi:5-methyltetrahydrofolate--homocysteine methyltransferase